MEIKKRTSLESLTPQKGTNRLPETQQTDRLNSILNIFKGVEEYVLNSDGVIVSSNLEAVTITGYEEWEVIGRNFSIFYSIEDQVKRVYEEHLDKALKDGVFYTSGVLVKKRNSPFWAKYKIEHQKGEREDLSSFRLTIQDATHRAIYSHDFNLVKEEYLNLFNNPFIGIFKFRISDFKILMVNEKAETIFGKNWNGLYLDSLFIDSSTFRQLIDKLLGDSRVDDYEFEIINRRGTKSWLSLSCKLFTTVGFVEGVVTDITDRKKEIEKTLSLSSELESFIYHASHDLRAPVTTLYGLVNLLKREHPYDGVCHYANLIEGRLFHLDNMLRDIVEIAFNTAVPVVAEKINFEQEVHHAVSLQKKNNQSITTNIEVSQQEPFFSDQTRVRSILRNIISNAFKYSNPSLKNQVVKIAILTDQDAVKIIVEDNGIGIKPESKERMFSLFYKASESSKGNGLGLYIVKSMIDLLGGEIRFESIIGSGTKFFVTIPNMVQGKVNSHRIHSPNPDLKTE